MIGALIGALLGLFLLHNPVGLLIGGAIGYLFDGSRRLTHRQHQNSGQYIGPLFAVLGAVAKADGRVSEAEIAVAERLMGRMGLNTEQRRHAISSFNTGKQSGFSPEQAIAQLRLWCGGRRDHAFPILDVVVETVLAEGASEGKLSLLRQLARALNVSEMELMAMMAMKGYAWNPGAGGRRYQPGGGGQRYTPPMRTQGPDPYAVLGIERNADERAIKRAYRKQISEHHPDRLGDLPEDLRRRAEQRASEINAAYERIKAERGLR
ncbi:co-chaperone DjlA [Oleiagrimonas sp. C23AA]|uniref:co-chaperone DjlA n=1 Tax=Oleiagrimonas sp. C23AA TaxID=2719047 RepID=UPI001421571D|nr:co-chaperone DjlA [Oleiagrimonas sp. C23AA]NII11889.1 co-chaperone DjlA [Oleiagrimonas sp. C23AA]